MSVLHMGSQLTVWYDFTRKLVEVFDEVRGDGVADGGVVVLFGGQSRSVLGQLDRQVHAPLDTRQHYQDKSSSEYLVPLDSGVKLNGHVGGAICLCMRRYDFA